VTSAKEMTFTSVTKEIAQSFREGRAVGDETKSHISEINKERAFYICQKFMRGEDIIINSQMGMYFRLKTNFEI